MTGCKNAKLDVLSVADMCVDLVLAGNVRPRFRQFEQIIGGYHLEVGGSANIFASQFAKLGGRAGVIGRVGEDVFGDFVLERLRACGVDTSRVARSAVKTGLGVALAEPDDRAILTYPGTIDATGPEDLPAEMLDGCGHWHVASYFLLNRLRSYWPAWLAHCKEKRLSVSLDPNWDPGARWEGVRPLLPQIDVFLPNEAEALAISGEGSVERAGAALAAVVPVVVVKRGCAGVAAFTAGGCFSVPALPVPAEAMVDTVGAGDNFDAGFLRAWLLGRGVPEAISLGQQCAAASLCAAGGIEGQLREEL